MPSGADATAAATRMAAGRAVSPARRRQSSSPIAASNPSAFQ